MPLLAAIDDEQLDQLCSALDRRHVPAGEWLFQAGEPSDAIYIVASGRFAVVGTAGQVFREMGSGDSIGDLGVIACAPRSAGVRAVRDGVVWRIAAEPFSQILTSAPQLQSVMLRAMAGMLQNSRSAEVSQRPRVVGVLSTGEAAAGPVVAKIAKRLDSYGDTAVLAPPVDTTAEVRNYGEFVESFSEDLDQAERTNDWVLLVAERDSGELWHQYVAAQSDRLVVLATQRNPPKSLKTLAGDGRPVHLVACRREPALSWWDLLEPVSQHAADDDGIGALARRIAGRSLGLVMSGGGARGLAHFGVFDELSRAGVVIDRFGGTSAGAIAAAAFAVGMDSEEAIATARRFLAHGNPLGDYTIPAVAVTRGGRIARMVENFVGDKFIEHLPHGFFALSADMMTGDEIIHRRGPLSLAVRASISIPGLMPPVQQDDRMLVDGGLLNQLPADVMTTDPDGDVICVDLRQKFVPSKGFGLLPPIVPLPGFVRRVLTGSDVALPPLQETLLRAVDMAGSGVNLSELPHIAAVISPDVTKIAPLEFKKFDAALDAGRAATRAVLDAQPTLSG